MSLWNITENITAEIGDYINYAMALSRNIETINMVVLNIIQYKLAAQEFPGTAHFISASQETNYDLVSRRFRGAF